MKHYAPIYPNKGELKTYISAASAKLEADLCIQNASIVNVFNSEIYTDKDVLIANGKILGIIDKNTAKAKKYHDAKKAYLLPAFIDGHVHIESSMLAPEHFAALALQNGTTTLVADPHEIANVLGMKGIKFMMDSLVNIPIHAYFMLPSCVPASPFENSGAQLEAEDLKSLIKDPRVLGLGEMMNYPGVLFTDEQVMDKLMLAHESEKMIDGHSPSLSGRELDAYIGSGIKTDHECTNVEEMQERIARGMYVLIRQGSSARDAERLLKGVNKNNAHRCCFCCDDISAREILENGYMQRHLRLAVEMGIEPIMAIQMLTINTATCFGLKNTGAIAPGYHANITLVDNLKDFNVIDVFFKGEKVVENKKLLIDLPEIHARKSLEKAMALAPYSLESFALKASGKCKVIGVQAKSIVTSSLIMDIVADEEGYFDYAKNPELCKIAVLERHKASGNIGLGLLHGYIKKNAKFNGAIASSVSHDSHNIVVIGDSDENMYLAVKTLEEHGGGIVLVKEGKIIEELPLPIAGLMSYEAAEYVSEVKARLDSFEHAEDIDPLILLSFLALSVIPELKITDKGLFDVLAFKHTSIQAE